MNVTSCVDRKVLYHIPSGQWVHESMADGRYNGLGELSEATLFKQDNRYVDDLRKYIDGGWWHDLSAPPAPEDLKWVRVEAMIRTLE